MTVQETMRPDAADVDTVMHPLEPLTPAEITQAATLVREEMRDLGDDIRFEVIELKEPPKKGVRDFSAGDTINREARVNVFRQGAIGVWRFVVSLSDGRILSNVHLPEARPMFSLKNSWRSRGL